MTGRARLLRRAPAAAAPWGPAAHDALLVVAAAHDRALAHALGPDVATGHVARAALAVQAGCVALPALPDALLADVAAWLEWAEAAPAPVVTEARAYAAAHRDVTASLEPLGALARWRRELRAGARQLGTEDALARAARWETVALERERAGDRASAFEALERAAEALLADIAVPVEGLPRPTRGRVAA